ncbi:MAG TPA: FliI/YscN family ATPase [Pirellulaceae bacterium]|nr:FliI/YscN family ATPase [Pirellulaceae bacterium]
MHALTKQLAEVVPTGLTGSIVRTEGVSAAVAGFPAPVGSLVHIERLSGGPVEAEVIGFRDGTTLIYPLAEMTGVRHGNRVRLARTTRHLRVGQELLGRVVNSRGRVIDGKPVPLLADRVRLNQRPPPAIERPRIDAPLSTGVRAIDGLLTCGLGQRIGIFAGSGVGKSVMLGMMTRYTSADVTVIGLIGERGREVNEFLDRDLGPQGLSRSVVVVATSDEPALLRVQAAQTATAIAEYFRDSGKNVLLIMDSITRFAMAQREIGLAAGEPPTTRGYPPSVFAMLPRLVERTGRSSLGSITAFYSVLVEGDDVTEPVSDAVRGLLDGHVILSRKLASQAHWPAVDVLESISRLFPDITPPQQQDAAMTIRQLLAAYRDHEDLISIGAYRAGANSMVDTAIALREEIHRYLRQAIQDGSSVETARHELLKLAQQCAAAKKAAIPMPVAAASPRKT